MRSRVVCLVVSAVGLLVSPAAAQSDLAQSRLERAMDGFWAADSVDDRAAVIGRVVEAGASFEQVARVLRTGRDYSPDVTTGRRLLSRRNRDGTEFPYVVHVPEAYDADRRYALHVYLHGGIMRPKRDDGSWWRNPERYLRDDAIVVAPTSWPEAIWWQHSQVENIAGVLNDVKRAYNVDENRVFLLGVSDGATGAYYHAFKAPTPWAGFLTFIGHPAVLANAASDVDGEMFVTNLTNKPFFVVNGGRDRLYPVSSVEPYVDLFTRAGVDVDFRPRPEAGHDMGWWPELVGSVDAFVGETRRDPLPDRLSWRTEDVDAFGRLHWLLVDELGEVGEIDAVERPEDFNTLVRRTPATQLGLSRVGELQGGEGLRLMDVGPGSVFELAGVEPDDVLRVVRGGQISTVDDLREQLVGFGPGEELPIVVQRAGRLVDLRLAYPTTWVEQERPAFSHREASGRVDLVRDGNTVSVTTHGVRRYTLLLSPDRFDFTQPIRVVTNGTLSHEAVVAPDVRTMLRWAVADQDRTVLIGAELSVDVVP